MNEAREAIGHPDLHFHDLRHTGNTWAAAAGASVKELMVRMGHASARAAMIYLHATSERDKKIAKGIGARVVKRLQEGHGGKASGTQRARKRKRGS